MKKGAIHRLLVFQGEPFNRKGQQRGTPARDQAKHNVIRAEVRDALEHAGGGTESGSIGDWMRGLDDLDAIARDAMAVAGNHETG